MKLYQVKTGSTSLNCEPRGAWFKYWVGANILCSTAYRAHPSLDPFVWHGGRVVKVLASICVWIEQTQVRIPHRTLFGYKARSIDTHSPTRTSSLEAGWYIGYQAELNIKARPGRVSSSDARLTMQQIPKRYENNYRHHSTECWGMKVDCWTKSK